MPTSRVFHKKPWLNKRGREILNRSARRIAHYRPDYVTSPEEPTLTECLFELQYHAAATGHAPQLSTEGLTDLPSMRESEGMDLPVDGGIFTNLLGSGLTFQEAICWFFYRYCGMDTAEVHLAIQGKNRSFSRADDSRAIRNVERTLESAAEKIGATYNSGEERTTYYSEATFPDIERTKDEPDVPENSG